mmetsp:Transcript_9516/g.24678  ORF Transcript_9516/g.24678 Transcript_9516/m.24678 type:complete len:221 (+) Transcript_9516:184-846(+)
MSVHTTAAYLHLGLSADAENRPVVGCWLEQPADQPKYLCRFKTASRRRVEPGGCQAATTKRGSRGAWLRSAEKITQTRIQGKEAWSAWRVSTRCVGEGSDKPAERPCHEARSMSTRSYYLEASAQVEGPCSDIGHHRFLRRLCRRPVHSAVGLDADDLVPQLHVRVVLLKVGHAHRLLPPHARALLRALRRALRLPPRWPSGARGLSTPQDALRTRLTWR